MKRFGVLIAIAMFAFASPSFADCDSTYTTEVQRQSGGDALVVCSNGTFDFRGYPSKASITIADTNGDTAEVSVQLQQDDGDNAQEHVVTLIISDTSANGQGLAATAPDTGVVDDGAGAFLNEPVTDKMITAQSNGSGLIETEIRHNATEDYWLRVVMPTGETLMSGKITFN